MEYVFLLLGFIVLLISGEFLVRGGIALSQHLKISTLVIGVTVISFGTSIPELMVSLEAVLKGHPDISIGNVIGSNISNIALVLGLTAIILPIPVRKNSMKFDWPVMMIAGILFYLFILNEILVFFEGLVFVVLLITFITWSIYNSRKEQNTINRKYNNPAISLFGSIILIIISSLGLVYGANWLVKGAVQIAKSFDVSEHAISVSIIAVGTSVPEITTSVIAALRKQTDISIGNIIGSNIFNIFGILGITSMIKNIPVKAFVIHFDIFWLLGMSLLLFLLFLPVKGGLLNRKKGLFLIILYISYICFVLIV